MLACQVEASGKKFRLRVGKLGRQRWGSQSAHRQVMSEKPKGEESQKEIQQEHSQSCRKSGLGDFSVGSG